MYIHMCIYICIYMSLCRKTNLREFYNLVYQYENDCLVAALEFNKDYYSDRDLKPTEELFFSLTIVPFANVGLPKISK